MSQTQTSATPFSQLDPARQKVAFAKAAERVQQVREAATPELQRIQAEILRRTKLSTLLADVPPCFGPLFRPSRYKGSYGGRGSAKSWTFAIMLLDRAMKQSGLRVVCVREVQKSLEQSVKRLLEDLIQAKGLGTEFRVLNTHIETPGDGVIIFQGMQNHTAESIKSLEGFDIAWVEEAQAMSARSLELLRPTIRKEGSELWFTWNPENQTDPVDQLLRGPVIPDDAIVVEANYRDNPNLPATLQKEMTWDRKRDIDKYEHVWLGAYQKHSEARVFKNWRVDTFDTPDDAAFLLGGDWGFATDPSVGVRMYVIGRTLFIDAEAYLVGCEIDDTPALFDSIGCKQDHQHTPELISLKGHRPGSLTQFDSNSRPTGSHCDGMARQWVMTADSARPETISYMHRHGYPRITPAKKGAGSVEEGITFLKNYDIVIHTRCVHTIDEFTSYRYKTHPLTGQVMPVLLDKKNHVIDSTRYGVEPIRNPVADFVTW